MGGTSEYRIAVAIADPANAAQLTRTAVDIARERDGEVLVLRVLVTERQSPFALYNDDVIIREFGGEEQEILDRVVETARGAVPVSGQLLVSFDVARALTNAVVEFDCDALIVGWQARERPSEIVLGSNIDRLVARTPSDVLVEKIGPADGVDSILVPVAEGPHAELAADVARAIAVANDAEINLLRVGTEDTTAERLLAGIAARVAPADVDREVRTGSVTDTVVEEASNHDITILGSTRQGMLRRQLVGSVPQAVGRRADTTVIITRREVGIRPRLTRLVRETL
ncbi:MULTISPECIES: universal stress protein [unclassified Haladaptatus]|uniref:universal stress protein n=1 Tax=unclassified Haladaptatus TaxID=2622732 RepID=UPI00209C4F7D|nr:MULTISPECIES: universal stress protein [unclassified Haladaptatus]MCO8242473.1 universal stress protein [Haladaptatus sp. AB643]MCO8252230.1 universal stress protein [Haladaptatus sp. AB618]